MAILSTEGVDVIKLIGPSRYCKRYSSTFPAQHRHAGQKQSEDSWHRVYLRVDLELDRLRKLLPDDLFCAVPMLSVRRTKNMYVRLEVR